LTQSHLDADHNIIISGYQKLWTEIRDHFIFKKKQLGDNPLAKLKRSDFREKWDSILGIILKETEEKTLALTV